jgi:hypothetical protein
MIAQLAQQIAQHLGYGQQGQQNYGQQQAWQPQFGQQSPFGSPAWR